MKEVCTVPAGTRLPFKDIQEPPAHTIFIPEHCVEYTSHSSAASSLENLLSADGLMELGVQGCVKACPKKHYHCGHGLAEPELQCDENSCVAFLGVEA
jgi:hypothetical protein